MAVIIQMNKTEAMDQALVQPHYSDKRFRKRQTIFLLTGYKLDREGQVRGAAYASSDELYSFGHGTLYDEPLIAAQEAVKDSNSAAFFETYLRLYFDKPNLELVHIDAGIHRGIGTGYRIYGFFPEGVPAATY